MIYCEKSKIWFSKEELDNEVWKDIFGWEGYYQASNLGRIRSLDRRDKNGKNSSMLYRGKLLKQRFDSNKRYVTDLSKNNKGRPQQVSRLVALAFHGECPRGMECCHNDGNCQNNREWNLRWDTRENNDRDKIRDGQVPKGENHWNAKNKAKDIIEIRKKYASGKYLQKDLATKYGLNVAYISQIINGHRWSWLK